MSMESLPFLGFRVLGMDTKNSNPKFTGKYQVFHYTFLFNAYSVSCTSHDMTMNKLPSLSVSTALSSNNAAALSYTDIK